MRFTALTDYASRHAADSYEAEAAQRHNARQEFIAEEIESLSRMNRILAYTDELQVCART